MDIIFDLMIIALLFASGSIIGWCIEVVFRRFEPDNKERLWINPGFLCGPYLPLYGFGLTLLYLLAASESHLNISNDILRKEILFAVMAVTMTFIELIAGEIFIIRRHIKLWDYSGERFNYKGIICLRFSIYWALIGALYYFFIHPRILVYLEWFSKNLLFSFFIGMFYGVFFIDLSYSFKLAAKIKAFADENEMIIRYEDLKRHIRSRARQTKEKYRFLRAFGTEQTFKERLTEYMQKQLEQAKMGRLNDFYNKKIKQSDNTKD